MKINWGYKILIVYVVFVTGILFLVYRANQERFDLVTSNYYEAELKYQDVIDQKARVAELSAPPQVSHSNNGISIALPQEFLNREVDGEIYLYRASDASKDIRKSFHTSSGSVELIFDGPLSGMYQLKLTWQQDKQSFYHEQRIFF